MDALIDWVTKIIIFLVLASVVDLLIPSTSMKKYVNVTVGIILILIFLKPVFSLFDMDIKQALNRSMTEMKSEETEDYNMENLTEIKKNEIESSQDAYILEEMAVQLKEAANPALQKKYDQEIKHINLEVEKGSDLTYENIDEKVEQATVTMQKVKTSEENITSVDEVVIDTNKPSKDKDTEKAANKSGIKSLLNDLWDVDKEKIILNEEGG